MTTAAARCWTWPAACRSVSRPWRGGRTTWPPSCTRPAPPAVAGRHAVARQPRNARVLHQYWGWRADDVLLHMLPIFHVHGLFVASHGALLAGARMIWLQARHRAGAALFAAQHGDDGRADLLRAPAGRCALRPQVCAKMRLFISGSAPLLAETFADFKQRSDHAILERYGMSETVMLTSNLCAGRRRAPGRHGRTGAAGRAE